jgi:hypothetical protein
MVGGVPRDYSMNLGPIKTTDIDLTTNTPDSLRLGILLADKLNSSFKIFDDNHITLYLNNYSIDFSSNFKSDDVIKELNRMGISDESLYEVYSRDFSINTLHQDLMTKEIFDLTGDALKDISDKAIKTPVDASITLSDDPRRVFRAIYFASKYNFSIDNSIIDYVLNNNDLIYSDSISDPFISAKISKAMLSNSSLTIKYLKDMNILSRVPLTGYFKDYLIKNRLVVEYLDNTRDDFLEKKSQIEDWSFAIGASPQSITKNSSYSISNCTPVIIGRSSELLGQLELFRKSIAAKESANDYAVAKQSASGWHAVGGYQILYENWYGKAFKDGYYFDNQQYLEEENRLCDASKDAVSGGTEIHGSINSCTECRDEGSVASKCYEWVKRGDDLPDSYSWVWSATGDRTNSFMLNAKEEKKYMDCARGDNCGALPHPLRQDLVAGNKMSEYFEKFYCKFYDENDPSNKQVWGAVAASWYSGEAQGALPYDSRRKTKQKYKDGRSKERCTGDSYEWVPDADDDSKGQCYVIFPSVYEYTNAVMNNYYREWSSLEKGGSSERYSEINSLLKFSRRQTNRDAGNMRDFNPDGDTYEGIKPRVVVYLGTGGMPDPIKISSKGKPSYDPGQEVNFLRHEVLLYAYEEWGAARDDSNTYTVVTSDPGPQKADVKITIGSEFSDWADTGKKYKENVSVEVSVHNGTSSKWERVGAVEFKTQEIYEGHYVSSVGPDKETYAEKQVKLAAKAQASKLLARVGPKLTSGQGTEDLKDAPWRYKLRRI